MSISIIVFFLSFMWQIGEKLGKMEVEKRQAVENEDYDKATTKKLQMDEYRLQVYKELNLNELLEISGVRIRIRLINQSIDKSFVKINK